MVPEWKTDGCMQKRHVDAPPGTAHVKAAPRYVETFRDSGIERDFSEAICDHFKAEGTDLRRIPSIGEQRVVVESIAGARKETEGEGDNGNDD